MSFHQKRCDIPFGWAPEVSHLFWSSNIMSPKKDKKGAHKPKKGSRSGNGGKSPKKGAGKAAPFLHGPQKRGKALAWQPSKEHPTFNKIVRYPADYPAEELRGKININQSRAATREAAIAFMDQNAVRLFMCNAMPTTTLICCTSLPKSLPHAVIKSGTGTQRRGKGTPYASPR